MSAEARPVVLAQSKLREYDESEPCGHCGRAIRYIVFLSNGKNVGRACAVKALGYDTQRVKEAPTVFAACQA
jgi:hypothetical protein